MIPDVKKLMQHLSQEICLHVDQAVVAMSGGADSTLVALLCRQALGAERVHTLHLPMSDYDVTHFNALSLQTAQHLGVHVMTIPICDAVEDVNSALTKALGMPLTPLNAGNTRARVRMTLLYGVAHALGDRYTGQKVRVMGTGNLSEDFIGYDTKGGDALGDIFPLGELFKSEVYQCLEYFKNQGVIEEAMIHRTPSAGLWPGQTDEKELGYAYQAMESSVRKIMAESWGELNSMDRFVLNRHLHNKHKHEAPVVLSARHMCH